MPRRPVATIVASLAATLLVPGASAATRELWPGVTYEHGVQFTSRGPVAINVIRGPKPGGLTTLEPVLSNETIVGRETLTAMQRRLAKTATAAGVNGDYFTIATGRPSGVLMRQAQLVTPPHSNRASAGVTTDGTLDIRRLGFAGTWHSTVQVRPLAAMNIAPRPGAVSLFTDAYGPSTPAVNGSVAVVLFPFPAATPDIDLIAPVVELRNDGGSVPIPPGGAVLVGTGPSATALTQEAPLGASMIVELGLRPSWPNVVDAIGGGPQIVRNGTAVFRAGEAFTTSQLGPRAPRSAVGQLRDGRIVLLAIDGRQPGYSVGLTNFELAQALVRLGAVTGMALDSGGSTTMAFDGALLNRPSDGQERRISTALMFLYRGIFVPEPPVRVSPNGDGFDETPNLRVRVVRPSSVKVTLTAPDGSTPVAETAQRAPGTYPVALPGATDDASATTAAVDEVAAGSWKLDVEAVDDVGATSAITRTFVVDDTLGFLRVPARANVPPGGRKVAIGWRLFRPARVIVTVVDDAGRVVRRVLATSQEEGQGGTAWDGLGSNGRRLTGRFVVRVVATSSLGASELTSPIALRSVA